jgi:alkylation response protein AidB-like acyl-CoA dehydrogenase
MMEPGAGSDLAGMRINAKEDGDNYIINDSEVFIMNGWMSDVCIICAKTDPDARAKEISLFLINTKTPGYRKGQKVRSAAVARRITEGYLLLTPFLIASLVAAEEDGYEGPGNCRALLR